MSDDRFRALTPLHIACSQASLIRRLASRLSSSEAVQPADHFDVFFRPCSSMGQNNILHSSGPMFLPPTCFRAGRNSSQEAAGALVFSGPVLRGCALAGDVATIAADRANRMIWRAMVVPLVAMPRNSHFLAL